MYQKLWWTINYFTTSLVPASQMWGYLASVPRCEEGSWPLLDFIPQTFQVIWDSSHMTWKVCGPHTTVFHPWILIKQQVCPLLRVMHQHYIVSGIRCIFHTVAVGNQQMCECEIWCEATIRCQSIMCAACRFEIIFIHAFVCTFPGSLWHDSTKHTVGKNEWEYEGGRVVRVCSLLRIISCSISSYQRHRSD